MLTTSAQELLTDLSQVSNIDESLLEKDVGEQVTKLKDELRVSINSDNVP